MKKIFVLLFLFCLLQLSFAGALPRAKAADLNMHITSPESGAIITINTFEVIGTFDSVPGTNNFKLIVTVGADTHTYNFTASGLTWGPVTVNMADFLHMVAGNSYTATLQASTQVLSIPPYQTGVRTLHGTLHLLPPSPFTFLQAGLSSLFRLI